MTKFCPTCEKVLSVEAFSKQTKRKGGLQWDCQKCQVRRNRLRLYGKTSDELNQIFINQGKKCGVCESKDPKTKKGWCVDHNHKTGEVRGVLCHPCNTKLYPLENDLVWLEKAQNYLYFGA